MEKNSKTRRKTRQQNSLMSGIKIINNDLQLMLLNGYHILFFQFGQLIFQFQNSSLRTVQTLDGEGILLLTGAELIAQRFHFSFQNFHPSIVLRIKNRGKSLTLEESKKFQNPSRAIGFESPPPFEKSRVEVKNCSGQNTKRLLIIMKNKRN